MIEPSRKRTHIEPHQPPRGGTPRWVWWVGLIAAMMILLLLVMHVAGGGLGGHVPPLHKFSLRTSGATGYAASLLPAGRLG